MCPLWPGQPITAHWGVPDPAAVEGTDERKLQAFEDTFRILEQRIERFVGLPISSLARPDLLRKVREIGEV